MSSQCRVTPAPSWSSRLSPEPTSGLARPPEVSRNAQGSATRPGQQGEGKRAEKRRQMASPAPPARLQPLCPPNRPPLPTRTPNPRAGCGTSLTRPVFFWDGELCRPSGPLAQWSSTYPEVQEPLEWKNPASGATDSERSLPRPPRAGRAGKPHSWLCHSLVVSLARPYKMTLW